MRYHSFLKSNLLVLTVLFLSLSSAQAAAPGCIGFAAVDGDDSQGMSIAGGTVGGAGGSAVTVTTQSQLTDAATQTGPLTIVVQGLITLSPLGKQIKVQSDKSILGFDCASGILNGTLDLDGKSNVILQNLILGQTYLPGDPAGKCCNYDAITLWHSTHHVWVDHCDLSHCEDGLCDITDKANYITVSWCHFHDHNKVSLIGSSDGSTTDRGYLKVTFHHNWFDHVWINAPRLRFGMVHLFNNYYTNVAQFCAWDTMAGQMVIENNNYGVSAIDPYLIGTPTPTYQPQVLASGNVFDPTATGATDTFGTAFNPATFYSYAATLESPLVVPTEAVTGTGPIGPTGPCGLAAPTATPVVAAAAVWRVVAGGPSFTDSQSNLWASDTQYAGGYAFPVTAAASISGSADSGLYQTERYGDLFNTNRFSYSFPVPPGNYQVTLKFAETDFTGAGQRVFGVVLNGSPVLSNFDIFADAGGAGKADDKVFNNIVPVSGFITVAFNPGNADSPKVNALQVVPQPPIPTATPTPAPPPPDRKPYVYSNPSSGPTVRFVYTMAESGTAHIRVWNASAQFVAGIADVQSAGVAQSTLNIQAFAPGHYFYQVDLKYNSGREDLFDPEVLAVQK